MATNLRLREETAEALRERANATGLSQQQLIRQAVDEYLGLAKPEPRRELPSWVIPAKEPMRRVEPTIVSRPGLSVDELLDREDRF